VTHADLEGASIPALLEEAMSSARDLASEELRLALSEADTQLASLQRVVGLCSLAAVLAGAGLAWIGTALVLASGFGPLALGVLGVLGLAASLLALWVGSRSMPALLFPRTRRRMERRVTNVKEALK
jgi:hypothetical protein